MFIRLGRLLGRLVGKVDAKAKEDGKADAAVVKAATDDDAPETFDLEPASLEHDDC